jgi:hypothetical protein
MNRVLFRYPLNTDAFTPPPHSSPSPVEPEEGGAHADGSLDYDHWQTRTRFQSLGHICGYWGDVEPLMDLFRSFSLTRNETPAMCLSLAMGGWEPWRVFYQQYLRTP